MPIRHWLIVYFCIALSSAYASPYPEYDTLEVHKLLSRAQDLKVKYSDSAFYYAKKADSIALAHNEHEWHARCTRFFGVLYFLQGNYLKALESNQDALDYYETTDRHQDIAKTLYNIGLVYSKTGYYSKATSYFLDALKIAEAHNFPEQEGAAYNSLGVVSKHLKQYQDARSYYQKAVEVYRQKGDFQQVAGSLSNIANLYLLMEKPDSAIFLHKQALKMFDSLDSDPGRVACYNNLAEGYRRKAQYDSAGRYIERSLALSAGKKSFHTSRLSSLMIQSEILYDRERYDEAVVILQELIGRIDGKERATLLKAYNLLGNCYERRGEFPKALKAVQQGQQIKDSLFNEQMTKAVTETKLDYELERKTNEIAVLKAENSAKDIYFFNIFLIVALVVVVIVLVVVSWNYRLRKKKASAEVKALQAQMNPHFIFNSLNSINRYITMADTETASSYLVKFSKLIRQVLENSNEDSISLENELTVLQLYVDMERLRFDNSFDMEIHITVQVNIDQLYVPALIFQPFVENAILHGLARKNGQGKINITIKQNLDHLFCVIEDNGIGRAAAANKRRRLQKTSLGMATTYLRLRALAGNTTYKEVNVIDLYDNEGAAAGTRVEFKLPLIGHESSAPSGNYFSSFIFKKSPSV